MKNKPILRNDIDMHIDDCLHRMAAADTTDSRKLWSERLTALINERNASRTPAQIAALEAAKGLK